MFWSANLSAIHFPDWSDLGMGHMSEATRYSWDYQLMECERIRRYYDGDVFKETVNVKDNQSQDAPLLFPVGLNLVKMLAEAQADATFGEWDYLPIQFGVRPDEQVSDTHMAAIKLANGIIEDSAAKMLWELDLDRQLFGGGAMKITPVKNSPSHIKWQRIARQSFFPIWDPDDDDHLLEVFIVIPMSAEQARAKYGLAEPSAEIVYRVEHWSEIIYENYVDGHRIDTYSGFNPWRVVPFVYTPRLRSSSWWGESLVSDVLAPQDELNMRIGDVGEAINYNSHPVRWGRNLPANFTAENFPLDANAMWDLGRPVAGQETPEVGLLEAKAAVSPGVFEHIKFIYDWSRTSVFAPPIAFGEDNGGGQRSGATLEIRMLPLIRSTRRGRSYMMTGLRQALAISAAILEQKEYPDVPKRAIHSLKSGMIVPQFAAMLPRDQGAAVDEVVKLRSTNPVPSVSLETAQSILGRGSGEVARIKEELKDKELHPDPKPDARPEGEHKEPANPEEANDKPKQQPDQKAE